MSDDFIIGDLGKSNAMREVFVDECSSKLVATQGSDVIIHNESGSVPDLESLKQFLATSQGVESIHFAKTSRLTDLEFLPYLPNVDGARIART